MKKSRIVQIEGKEIRFSNPDKVLFPEIGLTKWEMMIQALTLAPALLSFSKNRSLTTIRYPDGVGKKSFYQKNVPAYAPDFVSVHTDEDIQYIELDSTATYVWLLNLASLEYHVSFHQLSRPDYPRELVFDLDPSVPDFEKVIEVASATREVLKSIGLDGIAKTSGASGIQIYVPIEAKWTFEETRKINHFIGSYLAQKYPKLVSIERRVKDRGDKVYFDYLQHYRSKTLIAPYSPRATAMATVSAPVTWEELGKGIHPTDFTLLNMPDRLQQKGDLFQVFYQNHTYSLDPIFDVLNSSS
ncbi:non-homologous end-joining DNA ligase [Risungbinella massiliensis]|uniref:non-homologous end-joining DNA ligase n=1 Tax=Risungbinella massiliensis TaxID=1329796 RepID=UPI0005CBBD3C|nr:non-homologous end-joining DNA ligase [Risungbinella massiliensis]